MQVSKWGNSLAIRIPSVVVEALQLKDGDEVAIRIADQRDLIIERDRSRDDALAFIQSFAKKLPVDWKFDREGANGR